MTTQIASKPRARTRDGSRTTPPMKSITVDGSVEECYRAWRDLEGLPRFLSFVETIQPHRDSRFHWVARGKGGDRIEWDVDLVEDHPGEAMVWRSIPGSDIETVGVLSFEPATGGRGTVVRFGLEHSLRTGALKALAPRMKEKFEAKKELHRFKQWFETGEVATAGSRLCGPGVRAVKKGGRS